MNMSQPAHYVWWLAVMGGGGRMEDDDLVAI
jgi:hypothetical protein